MRLSDAAFVLLVIELLLMPMRLMAMQAPSRASVRADVDAEVSALILLMPMLMPMLMMPAAEEVLPD